MIWDECRSDDNSLYRFYLEWMLQVQHFINKFVNDFYLFIYLFVNNSAAVRGG